MRSLGAPACLVAGLVLMSGCEDGPDQPYAPAPPTAGSVWTSPEIDAAVVSPGTQAFDAGYPTTTKVTPCSTDFRRQRWAWMLTQPIVPPRFYAGIDMAGGDLWSGLTIGQAESPPASPTADGGGLCQSVPQGAGGTCPSGTGSCDQNYWGDNGEVTFSWNVATHLLDQLYIQLGYTGSISTKPYPDHTGAVHAYSLTLGDVARRDGEPFLLDWQGHPVPQITDIFNAAMATFASGGGIAWDTSDCTGDSTCASGEVCQCAHDPANPSQCMAGAAGQCGDADCSADGYCLVYPPGWTFGIRPLALYVVGNAGVPQPSLSTPTVFYNFWVKWEPFSNLPQTVELGPTGPVAQGTPIGAPAGSNLVCTQQIGQTFSDFTNDCVEVHGDRSNPNGIDAVNLNKVVNGLTHDAEHWSANVMGVNQNFTSLLVENDPNIVIQDSCNPPSSQCVASPQPSDPAQDFTFDVRAQGTTANDTTRGGVTNWRASSLIFIEWARLLLNDVARITGNPVKKLGDPSCTGFGPMNQPNYQLNPGCSGIEGLIVPGPGAQQGAKTPGYCNPGGGACDFSLDPHGSPSDPLGLNPTSNWDSSTLWYQQPVIKPNTLTGALCVDPVTQTDCTASVVPEGAVSIWENMLHQVTRVMGGGNVLALPPELQDVRYYFKWFGVAYTKYLKAYGNYPHATRDLFPTGMPGGGLGPTDVMVQPIDLESLFFDYSVAAASGGAETFDKFEYVDRDFDGVGSGGAFNWVPWDFEYGTDILGGNQRYDTWYRRMDREEVALYSAMLENKSDTPGQENDVNVTNLAGSPVLAAGWKSYACAIGQYSDPTVAGGNECAPVPGAPWNGNPPLDPGNPSNLASCASAACAMGLACITAPTHESGPESLCATPCDYTTYPQTGCPANQACALDTVTQTVAGCLDMMMDKNGAHPCADATGAPIACPAPSVVAAHPLLWRYQGAFGIPGSSPAAIARSPFGLGHSPITLAAADKQPGIGMARITIPNFLAGPYVPSPIAATTGGAAPCPGGYTVSADGVWCNAKLESGTGSTAPAFMPLTPWLEVGGGQTTNGGAVGFGIPEDGQRQQFLTTGQLDFTGVLESYVVDYVPFQDPVSPSCVSTGTCNPGFTCDPASALCVADDDTIRIEAIEGQDFLGQVFLCQDPTTGDVLHVGMYDSTATVLTWLANHPGANGGNGSAQSSCNILVSRTPYDNAVSEITSLSAGVELGFGGGQGQGRVTDVVVFDPTLIQSF